MDEEKKVIEILEDIKNKIGDEHSMGTVHGTLTEIKNLLSKLVEILEKKGEEK